MIILLILSLLFIWLIVREVDNPKELDNFSKSYIAILAIFALLSGYPFIDNWQFESKLSANASQLADNRRAKVKCVTVFESVFDKFETSGAGNPRTGEIVLPYPICDDLRGYLKSPETANTREINSLNLFTHEAMLVRGESNKQIAECQSVQRSIRSARLLGVRLHIAEQNAKDYYRGSYQAHPNFSEECAPGKKYDEDLSDSVW